MKFISLLYFFLLVLLINSCSEPAKHLPVDTVIGRGQLPNAAKDNQGNVSIVFGRGDSIMYTVSKNKGQSFSTASVVDVLTGLFAYAMRGPQIATTTKGTTIIACNKAGNIFAYVMNESGKWIQTGKVNDVDAVAKEGFLALSADGDNMFAVWLDLRGDKHNKIVGARSFDAGKSWSKNILVYTSPDSTVCECCKPSVAMKGANVYVMFRNWLNGNRDMHLIQSINGGNTFGAAIKLGNDSWALNGCPMDGGGLILNNEKPQTIWRKQRKLYTCEPSKPETVVGEGNNCTIEVIDGKNMYAWVEKENIVVLKPGHTKIIVGKGSLPVIRAVDKDHILCVWQQDMQIHTSVVAL
jgi:hypothetical protein